MAALTWYLTNASVGGTHQALSETSPGADATSSPNYGWTVGTTAPTEYSKAAAGARQAEASFLVTPIEPDGSITTTALAGDCWRTTIPYNGAFATGNWTFQMAVIALVGTVQRGNAGFRLFRSVNADGSGATEITGGRLEGNIIAGSPASQQTSIHNSTSLSVSLADEYLFVQIGWEITTAGGMSTHDIIHRIGTTASLVTSPNFTPTAGRQGPRAGATFASAAPGAIAWSVPANAAASDDAYAQAAFGAVLDQESESLNATNFSFTIPSGSTILGIRAEYERKSTVASVVRDLSVKLIKGGAISGDEKADIFLDWPTADTYKSYGGSDQLWGLSWTTTDINATNFGVQLRAKNATGVAGTAQVDDVRLTVWYSELISIGDQQGVVVRRVTRRSGTASSLLAFLSDPVVPAPTIQPSFFRPQRPSPRGHRAPYLFFPEFVEPTSLPVMPEQQFQAPPRRSTRNRLLPWFFSPEFVDITPPAFVPMPEATFLLAPRAIVRLRQYPWMFFIGLPIPDAPVVVCYPRIEIVAATYDRSSVAGSPYDRSGAAVPDFGRNPDATATFSRTTPSDAGHKRLDPPDCGIV